MTLWLMIVQNRTRTDVSLTLDEVRRIYDELAGAAGRATMPPPDGMLPVQAHRVDSLPNERGSARRGAGLARNGTKKVTG